MLEVIFGTDSESIISAVFFGNFENAISPVVRALWIFGIINGVVSDYVGIFEILSQIACTMTNETMAKLYKYLNLTFNAGEYNNALNSQIFLHESR